LKYLDTTTEDVDRLLKARHHINLGVAASFLIIVLTVLIDVVFFISYTNEFMAFFIIFNLPILTILIVINGNLVIKREMYSLAISIKERK
jgi:hypothetical protein